MGRIGYAVVFGLGLLWSGLAGDIPASAAERSSAKAAGSAYKTSGMCGPYPRVIARTPTWACVGLVAGPERGFIWPRSILEISSGRFVISDAAGWFKRGKGRVLSLAIGDDGRASVAPLITGRNLPHGLALGPDGRVYVGDEDAIWRFDPNVPSPRPEVIRDGLPGKRSHGGDHWHPLKQIVFGKDGGLLVNMGAPNDACERGPGKGERYPYPCRWRDGSEPDAAIWRLEMSWPEGRPGKFEPLARGLRNSLALAVHPLSGLVLQAENNVDLWGGRFDAGMPPEEFNVILPGRDYGWPYCVGDGEILPQYRKSAIRNCARFEAPLALLPAHAAPLALLYYDGPMFPELKGKLLVALHSARTVGHNLVAYGVDGDGRPLAPAADSRGRPRFPDAIIDLSGRQAPRATGRLSGMAAAGDGALYLVDDVARSVLVLLRSGSDAPTLQPEAEPVERVIARAPSGWSELYRGVLSPRCHECHATFTERDPNAAWGRLVDDGMIDDEDVAASALVLAMTGSGARRPMPPPSGPASSDVAALKRFLAGIKKRPAKP